MEEYSVIHSTFVIERSYPTTPAPVFGAFADPAKKRRWFIEGSNNEIEQYDWTSESGARNTPAFGSDRSPRSRASRVRITPFTTP
jgi:uncharacterized protein YndB with AHSA1/START domain